jgi:TPR repeat protein
LGQNFFEQDVKEALELASVCDHPNAVWLTKLFGEHDVHPTAVWLAPEEAREVFLACENDPRALCFAAFLGDLDDEIRRAAELGDAFAQAVMWRAGGKESFLWAEKSAAQGEGDGFCRVGYCYQHDVGCEEDLRKAKENFLVAAELMGWFLWASYLAKTILNDLFGLEELLQQGTLPTSSGKCWIIFATSVPERDMQRLFS